MRLLIIIYIKKQHLFKTTQPPHLVLLSNGCDVSQNAVHLVLRHPLADVVLDEATERRSDCTNVILTKVALFVTVLPKVQSKRQL